MTMKRTDKEIIEAMTFIKQKHNGEIPYQFGAFECAVMMAKYQSNEYTKHGGINSIAEEYAKFCIRCHQKYLPILCFEGYLKLTN